MAVTEQVQIEEFEKNFDGIRKRVKDYQSQFKEVQKILINQNNSSNIRNSLKLKFKSQTEAIKKENEFKLIAD